MDPAAATSPKAEKAGRLGGGSSGGSASSEQDTHEQHAPPPAPFHTSLPIPEHKTGWIIGKRGTYIKQLEKKSGADITVSDSTSKEYGTTWKYIQISGSGREADRAKKLLHIRLDRLVPPAGDGSKSDSYSDHSSDTASDAGDDSLFFPPPDADEYPNVANFKRQKKASGPADAAQAPSEAAAAPSHQLNADASVFAPTNASAAAAPDALSSAAPASAAAPTAASAAAPAPTTTVAAADAAQP